MPISSTGSRRRGVTLIELMVALAIITLIIGISFPSTIAGMENLRVSAGARSVATFMSVAVNRAERLQQAIEMTVFIKDNRAILRSADGRFAQRLDLPPGVSMSAVWPPLPEPSDEPRHFLFLPGGTPPRMAIEIANKRGTRRLVRLNPITGATEIATPAPEPE